MSAVADEENDDVPEPEAFYVLKVCQPACSSRS